MHLVCIVFPARLDIAASDKLAGNLNKCSGKPAGIIFSIDDNWRPALRMHNRHLGVMVGKVPSDREPRPTDWDMSTMSDCDLHDAKAKLHKSRSLGEVSNKTSADGWADVEDTDLGMPWAKRKAACLSTHRPHGRRPALPQKRFFLCAVASLLL